MLRGDNLALSIYVPRVVLSALVFSLRNHLGAYGYRFM